MTAAATYQTSDQTSETNVLGDLPVWDLSDLYPAPEAPELTRDLESAEADAKAFQARYQNGLAALDGDALAEAIGTYEAIEEVLGRVMSYAQLIHARDMGDPEAGRFYQNMQERTTDISTALLFFTLELNRLEEAVLEAKLASPALSRYRPWLRDIRAFRDHQLSDELESLLHEKQVAGRAAWIRLFDETMADLRFDFDGERLTSTEVLHKLTDHDGAVRKAAAKSFAQGLGENIRTFALITNTLAKDKEIEDKWRDFTAPVSSRNLANFVEDEVVDAL